ncbi:MAG: hypothetical protein QGG71_27005, partial [Pirellulaceae bacterium]|nr:hypothetical protein [Pirellulaceae bacterium]
MIQRLPRSSRDLVGHLNSRLGLLKSLARIVGILDVGKDRGTGLCCERRLKTLALGRLKRLAPDVVLLL